MLIWLIKYQQFKKKYTGDEIPWIVRTALSADKKKDPVVTCCYCLVVEIAQGTYDANTGVV